MYKRQDYEQQFAVIELLGEWNDAIENDIMTLRREVTDRMFMQGITHFVLIAVSYTHLDVYKRQTHAKAEGRSP